MSLVDSGLSLVKAPDNRDFFKELIVSSIREQINILSKKGMIFSSKKKARDCLRENNYYNVVNAYKDNFIDLTYVPFKQDDPNEKFKPGTSFDEFYSLFKFDKYISEIFLKYFLRVENRFKTHLAYEFAYLFGEDAYINKDCFDTEGDHIFDVLRLQSTINEKISKNKNDERVKHFYLDKNINIPIWSLISLLEIGTARVFYANCKDNLKKKVAYYYSVNPNQLMSMLSTVNMFRNVCAHDSRLYCYKINDYNKQISNMPIHSFLHLNVGKNGWYLMGKQDLFSAVIALKYLLDDSSFEEFIKALKKTIDDLSTCLHTINVQDVLNKMGFPIEDLSTGQKNWFEIVDLPKF